MTLRWNETRTARSDDGIQVAEDSRRTFVRPPDRREEHDGLKILQSKADEMISPKVAACHRR